MKTIRFAALALLVLGSAAACASAESRGPRTSANRITAEELAEVSRDVTNLYDVVSRLRPRWLSNRSPGSLAGGSYGIVVYMEQSFLGGPEELRNLSPDVATSLRYLDTSEAVAQLPGLGSRGVAGAIVIKTR